MPNSRRPRQTPIRVLAVAVAVLAGCTSCGHRTDVTPADPATPRAATPPPLGNSPAPDPVVYPTDPDPADPDPTDPDPTDPDPTDPDPTDPDPTDPDPTDPDPTDTDPLDADPLDAEPLDAAATGPTSSKKNPLGGCQQCHVDVEDELVGTVHFDEEVGCIECHGRSEGHLADENNEVLPDRVFSRKDSDPFCEKCHECPRPADPKPAHPTQQKKICTDCHGAHDLKMKMGSGLVSPGEPPGD